MKLNRAKFFDAVRITPFPGKLSVRQVQGMGAILDEFERRNLDDPRHLAYMLGTTKWETDHTMQPIKEGGGLAYLKSKKYYPWYGRGYVQLTWLRNYQAFHDEVLHLFMQDIIENPDAAMSPPIAAYIMFEGMEKGTFTGKKLSDYFNSKVTDWRNARKIINGLDRAAEIAGIAKEFYSAILKSKE